MSTKVMSNSVQQLVQLMLDKEYGEGKTCANQKNTIKFLFPETYNGCNELEVGTWKLLKDRLVVYIGIEYIEAYEHLKCGTKPDNSNVLIVDQNLFNFPAPKDIA